MKLNLGAGESIIEGFEPRDGKTGDFLYPLPDADGSVDEIRASHVLEHFSHLEVASVLHNWVAKLKPGGRIRIAVPDFQKIAREYLEGKDINVMGYTFGGQVDERDYHKSGFDKETMVELFISAGLERLHEWKSEIQDAASLPISLNLGGYKPLRMEKVCTGTTAVLSAPRFGPVMHFRFVSQALMRAGVQYQIGAGAYWHQVLSEIMEMQIAIPETRYVITCDYDTICSHAEIVELYRLMEAYPEADAIVPLQSKRGSDEVLFGIQKENGEYVTAMAAHNLERNLLPITTGHFGLTIFRADSLRSLPRPWMEPVPNQDGRWTDGKIDADIDFWHRWKKSGKTLFLAPRVVIGHVQEIIIWPGKDLMPVYQSETDYDQAGGMPEEVRR